MNPKLEKYNAIIIDPDLPTRSRLKQAAHNVPVFGKVIAVNALNEALVKVRNKEPFDVIFMAFTFGEENIQRFIESARETPVGEDCAYILVLKASDQDGGTTAKSIAIGANGFLFEPYSVDALQEITQLAKKIKLENQRKRLEASIDIMASTLSQRIEASLMDPKSQRELEKDLSDLEKNCKRFFESYGESKDSIVNPLRERFEERKAQGPVVYSGPSKRVRKMYENLHQDETES